MSIDIYKYSDYREYLKDLFATRKTANSAFSLRYYARKAGINSSSYFKYVMEGKVNLTKGTIFKTCTAFNIKDKEAEYFETLVFFNQAETTAEKNRYFAELTGLRNESDKKYTLEDQYDYYSAWYHPVVRELACMIDFKEDYKALANALCPTIPPRKAEESVRLLVKLGFLVKKEDGRYQQADPILSTGYDIKAFQIVQYQIEILKLAIESFDRFKGKEKSMSTLTFSVSEPTFKAIKDKSREFRSQVLALVRNDVNPALVYQMSINLFPVAVPRRNPS